MKFLLFDREENYIGTLKDVLEAKQTEEINGEDVLELSVLEQKVENFSDEWGRNYFRPSLVNNLAWLNVGGIGYGVLGSNTNWRGFYIPVTAGDVYSLSRNELTNNRFGVYFTVQEPANGVPTLSESYRDDSALNIEGIIVPANANYLFVYLSNQADEIPKIKLEKGSVATPWTPAPEDLDIKPQDTIEKGYKLVYKDKYGFWKEFIVKEIEESHTSDGIEKRIFCESSFYETFGDYIEDKRPSGTASHALSVALEPTRWEVGIVDDLGINSVNFYQISAKEAIHKVAETWQGEIRTRVEVVGNKIVHRYVDILARRGGDFGQRFTYSKNLESVTKTIHREDVITALYGYGKGEEVGDGHGLRIDFASINDGKAYVENNEAKEIWGRSNGDGTKSHVYGKVEFDDCEDKQELLQLTTEKLEEVSSPLITYEAKAIDLGGADLGDDVAVIDNEFTPELRLKARVIKIVRDLIEEENNDLTLGNFVPSIVDSWNKQEEFINNFRSKAGVWDRAKIIDSDGTINAQFINNIVDELNRKMNAQGGYVYVSEDGKGLITYDKPIDQDPTMAIQILGGAFRIANSKLPNGEFDWRTFGTGAGFTADEFVAGVLRGGKVHFDLTNGTFLIGDSIEDYILYFDGTTLKVRLGTGKTVEESLQDIQNYADTKASQAESAAKAYAELKAQEKVDSLEIGGRNLLRNSGGERESSSGLVPYPFTEEDLKDVNVGDTITYSFWARLKNDDTYGDSIDAYFRTSSAIILSTNMPTQKVTEEWKLFKYTFVLDEQAKYETVTFRMRCNQYVGNNTQNIDVLVRNVKIEKGTKATDWTPAPEDVDEAISTVDTKYSNKVAEINTTIDSITQRVESTETNITTIGGTVSSLSTRMDTAEQKITPTAIVQTVRQSTAYQGDLEGVVDSLEIGGRNLVLKSKAQLTQVTVKQYGYSGMLRVPIDGVKVKHGDTVTFSVYIADIPEGEAVRLRLDWYRENGTYSNVTSSDPWSSEDGRYIFTATVPENTEFTEIRGRIMPHAWTANYQIKYMHDKLEKGNKATDWTPAPEDVDEAISTVDTKYSNKVAEINTTIDSITQRVESTESDITTINGIVAAHNTRIESAESKITPNAIVQTVRSSTAYTNDLNGKVSKSNIISEINQSAEEVQINANRVKIGMGTTFEQGQIYTWNQYLGKTWNQMNS